MAGKRYRLHGRVSSSRPDAVKPVLEKGFKKGELSRLGDEFLVEAEMRGESAKELNRSLLSELRRAEKRTRLRAEWVSDDGTTERYFDYVLKKTFKASAPSNDA